MLKDEYWCLVDLLAEKIPDTDENWDTCYEAALKALNDELPMLSPQGVIARTNNLNAMWNRVDGAVYRLAECTSAEQVFLNIALYALTEDVCDIAGQHHDRAGTPPTPENT